MRSLSILLADDEESIRVLVDQLLCAAGHTVTVVSNAREAAEHLRRTKYDLLIADAPMPDGDGVDLIAEVKKFQP